MESRERKTSLKAVSSNECNACGCGQLVHHQCPTPVVVHLIIFQVNLFTLVSLVVLRLFGVVYK